MKILKKSLVARLVSYFLFLSLFTLILIGYLAFNQAREALKRSVLNRLDAAATLKEDQLDHWVNNQRQEVQFIASLPEVRAQTELLLSANESEPQHRSAYSALSEYFALVAANKSAFKEIFILTNGGGKVIISTDKDHEGEFRVKDRYYTEGQLGTFVQNVYPSPVTFNPTMTISTPLLTPAGEQVGVLATHLNLEQMDRIILERTGLGKSGETYLVDRFNVFTSGDRFGRKKFSRGVHTVGIDEALQGLKGSKLYLNYEGTPVIGVYRWLDNLELALLAEMHQKEAFAPARELALTIFLVGLILAGLLAAGVYFLARRIARPVLAITDAAVQVASGDLTPTAPVITDDEIGVLASTFNKMTDQLRDLYTSLEEKVKALNKAKEALHKLNSELEQRVEKRTKQLKAAQKELVERAHKAGQADIATGVLHNVGNILNSVNTSAAVITETLENSRLDGFVKANAILKDKLENLEDFIANNPKGKKLIRYYFELENIFQQEHSRLISSTNRLKEKISAINDVILTQQTYAKAKFFSEKLQLSQIVENALSLQSGSISKYNVQVIKNFNECPDVLVQKTKLVQMLLNLNKNAIEAMEKVDPTEKKLTIEIKNDDMNAYITVSDTGHGVKKENLGKIFTHGFTTKENGHGFGLHSCANYMTEMKGKIWVESEGEGKGTTFVLSFPLKGSDENDSIHVVDENELDQVPSPTSIE